MRADLKEELKWRTSLLLKKGVRLTGLLRWWEEHVTNWPSVLFYHYVGNHPPAFLADIAVTRDSFLEQISALRRRYRFISWPEYKEALVSPREAKRSILLTFDDGFHSSWLTMQELASEQRIPSVFFVNTRVLDNAYAPWTIQYYFLRSQAKGGFLEPLWKSVSNGKALTPAAARERCHQCFSLGGVVEPIEAGLAQFGITPAELAQQNQLYISSTQIRHRNNLLEIGNHSHSHYILSKLSNSELERDLRASHAILAGLSNAEPECFAYPFGIPEAHFDDKSSASLRGISSYPYIFSGTSDLSPAALRRKEIRRICLDKVKPQEAVAAAAQVRPRALKKWFEGRPSMRK